MASKPVVLFVEDDLPLQALLQAIASRNRWHAVFVDDGRKALRLLSRGGFDAVVLDLLLPEVNGFDVLRDLKCRKPQLLPRVVVISAATPLTTAGCTELCLVKNFLRKPFDIADLEREIGECVGLGAGLEEEDRRPVEGAQAEHAETGRRSGMTRHRVS